MESKQVVQGRNAMRWVKTRSMVMSGSGVVILVSIVVLVITGVVQLPGLVTPQSAVTITPRPVLETGLQYLGNVAFSPDGKILAAGADIRLPDKSIEGAIVLWDTQTGQQLRTLPANPPLQVDAVFSPDGTMLAVPAGRRITLLKLVDGTVIQSMEEVPDGFFGRAAFTPDGRMVAAPQVEHAPSKKGGVVAIWNVQTGNRLRTFEGAEGDLSNNLVFSLDGTKIIAGSGSGKLLVWDTQSGELLQNMQGPATKVNFVALSPDGARIAASYTEGHIVVWDAASGKQSLMLDASAGGYPAGLAFSPDGSLLATSTFDGHVMIWDMSGQSIASFEPHTELHYDYPVIAFSPDGTILAASGGKGSVALWDVKH